MFADAGLDAAQISLLFIVWSLTAFFLEVPSGVIADKFPRKNVLIIATLFQAGAFACWLIWPTFWGFLAGFLLWGINSALSSGTEEALLYDELKRANTEKQYAKVAGRTEALDLVGTIAGGFAAAALASAGYQPILVLSVLGVLISAGAIMLLPRAPAIETTGETKYLSYLSEGIRIALRKSKILFLLLFMGIVTGLGAVDEYFGLLFNEQGMENSQIAFWMGVVFLFGAVGSVVAHKLEAKRLPFTAGIIIWAGLLLLATLLPAMLAPFAIGLYVALFYILKILFGAYIQHEINDRNRATITSVGGLLVEAGR